MIENKRWRSPLLWITGGVLLLWIIVSHVIRAIFGLVEDSAQKAWDAAEYDDSDYSEVLRAYSDAQDVSDQWDQLVNLGLGVALLALVIVAVAAAFIPRVAPKVDAGS